MDLLTLAAKLTLDSSSFTSGISDAEKQGSTLSQKLGKVASAAKKVAGALVFKKGIQAIKNLANETAKAGDAIDKNSQKLGMSRKGYQEWSYILSQCGTDISSMSTSMKTLNSKILSGSEAVGKLGLSFEDLSKMNMEQQFEAVVKAFQEMPEGAEKSALAVELFGKNGMELLPLLNSSAESIDELKQKFHELGIEMSDDQIDAAVRYTDAMDTLTRVFDGIKYAIGAEVLPIMAEWAEKGAAYAGKLLKAFKGEDGGEGGLSAVFKVMSEDFQGWIDTLKENDNPVLQKVGEALQFVKDTAEIIVGLFTNFDQTVAKLQESDNPVLETLGGALEGLQAALQWCVDHQETVVTAIAAIVAAFAVSQIASFVANLNPVVVILAALAAAATLIATNWEAIKQRVIDVWNAIKDAVTQAWEAVEKWWTENVADPISEAWEAVQQAVEKVWNNIKTTATTIWNNIKNTIREKITAAKTALDTIWNNISTAASTAWEAVKTSATQIWTNIKNAIRQPIQAAKEAVAKIWDAVKEKAETVWNAIKTTLDPILSAISSAIDAVATAVQSVIDFLTQLFGFNGRSCKTSSEHTHTETTINRTINIGGEEVDVTLPEDLQPSFFAKGNWNVPFDNFPSLLHRGEMVLTASQARRFRAGEGGDGGGMDVAALTDAIVAAVKQGMEGATVKSFLDGRNVTNEVMRIAGNNRLNARFT